MVKQFLLDSSPMAESDGPHAAVAFDEATGEVRVAFKESAQVEDDQKVSLTDNFVQRGEAWARGLVNTELYETLDDLLKYNLYSVGSETTEYDTFEQAQAAAQEAFGE
jgi:hypothetical protein